MIKVLQAPVTSMMLGGLCFLLTMAALLQKPLAAHPGGTPSETHSAEATFWDKHNPEIDQLLQELKNEKQALARRDAELKELAVRLEAERAEINQVTQRVARLQAEFDQNFIRVKEEEAPKLKKLARMYASMSPEGASAIFRELDDQVIVKFMSFMKESESASLLDAMATGGEAQAKRAAGLSEALRKSLGEKSKTP
jgi:flagellar motility protein MotE (MotC chaperone)